MVVMKDIGKRNVCNTFHADSVEKDIGLKFQKLDMKTKTKRHIKFSLLKQICFCDNSLLVAHQEIICPQNKAHFMILNNIK